MGESYSRSDLGKVHGAFFLLCSSAHFINLIALICLLYVFIFDGGPRHPLLKRFELGSLWDKRSNLSVVYVFVNFFVLIVFRASLNVFFNIFNSSFPILYYCTKLFGTCLILLTWHYCIICCFFDIFSFFFFLLTISVEQKVCMNAVTDLCLKSHQAHTEILQNSQNCARHHCILVCKIFSLIWLGFQSLVLYSLTYSVFQYSRYSDIFP